MENWQEVSIHLRPTGFNTTSLGMVPNGRLWILWGMKRKELDLYEMNLQVYKQTLLLPAKVSISFLSVVLEQCHQPRTRSHNSIVLCIMEWIISNHGFFMPPTYICLLVINRK